MPSPLTLPPELAAVAGVPAPAAAHPAGYAAIIAAHDLRVPPPDEMIAIGDTHTLRQDGRWRILTPRYRPGDTLRDHLDFAFRHEAIDLAVLNALFRTMPTDVIVEWVKSEPTGQHARRIWFLYEWLTGTRLDLPDAPKAPYVGVLDEKRQFTAKGETVTRYRVRNNLPGTPDFCPLVRALGAACRHIEPGPCRRGARGRPAHGAGLMARAAAFLLLEDSKALLCHRGRTARDRTAFSGGGRPSAKPDSDRSAATNSCTCSASSSATRASPTWAGAPKADLSASATAKTMRPFPILSAHGPRTLPL